MRRRIRSLAVLLTLSISIACNSNWQPMGPSPITNSGFSNLQAWAPCVTVHTPGRFGDSTLENQMAEVEKLQRAGRISWVRFGGDSLDYFIRSRQMGLKTFGIIALEELERLGWERAFDMKYRTHPADIWEIAGEISNSDPYVNPSGTTTPEIFMPKFKRLYEHVRTNYPGVVLASPPTFGSGSVGAVELERFIELGMLDMDVIVTINVYTEHALSRYSAVFAKYGSQLSHKRVWVTETGMPDPDRQVDWVENFYPKLVNTFRPEMICWYALWVGDQPGGDNPFGLVTNLNNGQPITERTLFKMLTGVR